MAFLSRVGSILKQNVSKQLGSQIASKISASNPSIYQSLRCMSSSNLFIGGLPNAVDDSSLRDTFSRYGEVLEARVIIDREQNRSRGFVTFASSDEASSAIQAMDEQDVQGRRVRVTYASDRTPRPYSGGGYGGGRFYGGYGGGFNSGYRGSGSGSGSGSGYDIQNYGGDSSDDEYCVGQNYGGGNSGGGYGGGPNYGGAGSGYGGGAAASNVAVDTGFARSGFEDNSIGGQNYGGSNPGATNPSSEYDGGAAASNVTVDTGFVSGGFEDSSIDTIGNNVDSIGELDGNFVEGVIDMVFDSS